MSTIESSSDKVAEIISTELFVDTETIKPESLLAEDLGMDSLDSVEVVIALEEEFDINISDAEIDKVKTVQDVVKLVDKLVAEK